MVWSDRNLINGVGDGCDFIITLFLVCFGILDDVCGEDGER